MAEGGSDWSTYYVRELGTGKQLPDVIRWVKFSDLSWTEDGKGFFYGRYPEPRAGKALEDAVRDKKIYYHALGTNQSADRLIYERRDEPTLRTRAGTSIEAVAPEGEIVEAGVEAHAVHAWLDRNETLPVPANFRVDRFGLDRRAEPLVKRRRCVAAGHTAPRRP